MDLDSFRGRWAGVRAGLLELVTCLDEGDLAFRPFASSWDVGTLLRHIAHEEEIEVTWGLRHAVAELPAAPSADAFSTPEQVRALLERVHAGTRGYLDQLADADLESEVEIAWGTRGRLGDLLWRPLEHEIHHRGELSLLLGMLGRGGLDV